MIMEKAGIVKKRRAPMEKARRRKLYIGWEVVEYFITTVVPRIVPLVPIGGNVRGVKADTLCKTVNAFLNANGMNTGTRRDNAGPVQT